MARPAIPQPHPTILSANMAALRLIATHGGSFQFTCAAATCTRRAHWRYYPERNPRLAELLIVAGAYEVYMAVDGDGFPMYPETYVVLERADGPAGSLYADSQCFTTYAAAIRYAAEKSIDSIRQEIGGAPVPPPAPVPGIAYAG